MHIEINIDAHSREATFRRTIHPMNVGDLHTVSRALDKVYLEAKEWVEREKQREG